MKMNFPTTDRHRWVNYLVIKKMNLQYEYIACLKPRLYINYNKVHENQLYVQYECAI